MGAFPRQTKRFHLSEASPTYRQDVPASVQSSAKGAPLTATTGRRRSFLTLGCGNRAFPVTSDASTAFLKKPLAVSAAGVDVIASEAACFLVFDELLTRHLRPRLVVGSLDSPGVARVGRVVS